MTTTMTTIGYGDFSAAKFDTDEKGSNMILVSLLEFASIFTFTLIVDMLFSLRFDTSLSETLYAKETEADLFL